MCSQNGQVGKGQLNGCLDLKGQRTAPKAVATDKSITCLFGDLWVFR